MRLLFWCKSFMAKAEDCVCAFPSLRMQRERTGRERELEGGVQFTVT